MPKRSPVELLLDQPVTFDEETFALRSFVLEEIAPDPNGSAAYPGGSGLTLTIETPSGSVALSELPAAYGPVKVGWTTEHRVELIGHDTRRPSVAVYIDRIGEPLAETRHQLRIARSARIALGTSTMRFDSHGHKIIEEGQTSPLIVRVTYEPDSRHPEEASYNVELERRPWWRWHDYELAIVGYEYDAFMELAVTRLALEPVGP